MQIKDIRSAAAASSRAAVAASAALTAVAMTQAAAARAATRAARAAQKAASSAAAALPGMTGQSQGQGQGQGHSGTSGGGDRSGGLGSWEEGGLPPSGWDSSRRSYDDNGYRSSYGSEATSGNGAGPAAETSGVTRAGEAERGSAYDSNGSGTNGNGRSQQLQQQRLQHDVGPGGNGNGAGPGPGSGGSAARGSLGTGGPGSAIDMSMSSLESVGSVGSVWGDDRSPGGGLDAFDVAGVGGVDSRAGPSNSGTAPALVHQQQGQGQQAQAMQVQPIKVIIPACDNDVSLTGSDDGAATPSGDPAGGRVDGEGGWLAGWKQAGRDALQVVMPLPPNKRGEAAEGSTPRGRAEESPDSPAAATAGHWWDTAAGMLPWVGRRKEGDDAAKAKAAGEAKAKAEEAERKQKAVAGGEEGGGWWGFFAK